MYVMSRTTAIAIAHQGAELKVIACVVVGGTLITGDMVRLVAPYWGCVSWLLWILASTSWPMITSGWTLE